jgi:hypothetical protein
MLPRFVDVGLKCFSSLPRVLRFQVMLFVVLPSTGKASSQPLSVSNQLIVLRLRSQTMITRSGHAPIRSGDARGVLAVAASSHVAAPSLRSQRHQKMSMPQLVALLTSRAGVQPQSLKSQTVSPITGSLYRAADTEVLASLSLCHLVLLCQVMQGVTLCQHIHLLYFRGEASAAVRALLHGLVYVQRLTLRGPYEQKVSTVALNEFELVSPDQQAGSAPSVATVLPADWAVSLFGREGLEAARELVVAYDVPFRPGELLACSVCNILLPRAAAVSEMAFLVVTIAPSGDTAGAASKPRTKAGSYDGTKLSVVCPAKISGSDVASAALIAHRILRVSSQPCSALSLLRLEAIMREASVALGFTAFRWTPHTCRHDGTSSDLASRHLSLEKVSTPWRWLAFASVGRFTFGPFGTAALFQAS